MEVTLGYCELGSQETMHTSVWLLEILPLTHLQVHVSLLEDIFLKKNHMEYKGDHPVEAKLVHLSLLCPRS